MILQTAHEMLSHPSYANQCGTMAELPHLWQSGVTQVCQTYSSALSMVCRYEAEPEAPKFINAAV